MQIEGLWKFSAYYFFCPLQPGCRWINLVLCYCSYQLFHLRCSLLCFYPYPIHFCCPLSPRASLRFDVNPWNLILSMETTLKCGPSSDDVTLKCRIFSGANQGVGGDFERRTVTAGSVVDHRVSYFMAMRIRSTLTIFHTQTSLP